MDLHRSKNDNKANFSVLKILPILALALLTLNTKSNAQSVIHPYGTFCVGQMNVFAYTGPGTVISWSVTGPYTMLSQSGNSIQVKWNSATYGASVTATYNYNGTHTVYYNSINIGTTVTPSVSISSNINNVCVGTSVTFTATPVNGGSSPYYVWQVNGASISGANSGTYTTSSLTNGQQVSCILYTSAACYTAGTATSNAITAAVVSPQQTNVSISGSTSICTGSSASFTASASNIGANPVYHWKRNGYDVSSSISGPPPYVLVLNSVSNGDVISCVVSSDGCNMAGTSNSLTISLTSPQNFTAGVSPNNISFCAGQNVTFTANTSQPATSYQWQFNGSNIANANSNTYTVAASSVAQLKAIGVYATTGAGCLNNYSATGTASSVPFTVNPVVTPSVSISSNVGINICAGSQATFTATPVNGGSAPGYQWQLNGASVAGQTSNTFTTSGLTDGQQVSCLLTTSLPCATSNTVSSNAITMTVNQVQAMSATISGNATICQGSPASFVAYPSNYSGNLSYQWERNGSNVSSDWQGGQIPPYVLSYSQVGNNDVYRCVISTDAACYLPATSNSITINITQQQVFQPGITPSKISPCKDEVITLTAHSSQAITGYQWKMNGSSIAGQTGSTYQATASSVDDLHAISVDVTAAGGQCLSNTSSTATSINIPYSIAPFVYPAVSFTTNPSDVIQNTPVTFTAVPVSPGNFPSYQWQINGEDVSDATGSSFTHTFSSGSDIQSVSLTMISNDVCAVNPTANNSRQVKIHSKFWENLNYVRVHDILIPGVMDWISVDDLAIGDKLQSTTYYDGLGRPIEKVGKETATPDPAQPGGQWGDNVQFNRYDELGREPKLFVPYSTTAESGQYKATAEDEQSQYIDSKFDESNGYKEMTFESSPLNRVAKVTVPGSVGSQSAGNSVSYQLNDVSDDDVKIWRIGYNPTDYPVSTEVYPSNSLFKTTITDDKGSNIVEYTNTAGQVILKKVQIDQNHPTAYSGWICTYNVYNELGELRFTIEPQAVKYLEENNWSFDGTNGQKVLEELCFRYEYDEKGRITLKKSPGSKEIKMIYDKRDRLVFSQDGNQRNRTPNEWSTTLYDQLDRSVLSALYETSKSITDLQNDIANAGTGSNISITSQGETIATYNSPLTGTDLNSPTTTTIIKYLFYDDYSYGGAKGFSSSFDNGLAYPNGDPIAPTQRTLNLPTGTIVRILGSDNFLTSTVYYDEKGRIIQNLEDNMKNGGDVTTYQYGFDGRLLSTNTEHSTANSGYTNYSIVTRNLFDRIGRITGIQKKFGTNDFKSITSYDYDDAGKLKTKHLDPGYTGSGKNEMESLDYNYNINDQLTGINKDYALKTPGKYDKWANFFGVYLGYDNKDELFAANQLDGQVTGVIWNTQGDDAQRKYDFTYDDAGRLSGALFNQKQDPGDSWSHATVDFSAMGANGKIEYDLSGNLVYMLQKGVIPGNSSPVNIDDLHYAYGNNGLSNKLVSISDNSNAGDANGKLGDFKHVNEGGNDDYVYDDNGNLAVDLNKNISELGGVTGADGIKYNFLDKPEEIHIPGKGTIKMVYDGDGNKLQRSFTADGSSTSITTTYINDFIYQGNDVQYINFEEGRLRVMQTVNQDNGYDVLNIDGNIDLPGNKRGTFDFFIKDYLNNVRMIVTEETHQGSNSCTMETARATNEESLFGQVDASGVPTADNEVKARFATSDIPGQLSDNGWKNNTIGNYVSRIGNLAGKKVGPNVLMKVMAGDQISAKTIYYYQSPVENNNDGVQLLTDVLTSLGQAIAGGGSTSGLIHGASTAGNITSQLNASVPFSALTDPDANNIVGDAPKAYLTVLFFDERFNPVPSANFHYRVSQSGNDAAPLIATSLSAPKNGYAFVYVSNESDEMVYFDNLQVTNTHGRIIEENHYYAYGLKIAGISSKKLGDPGEGALDNKYQYQGEFSEFNDETGWNEFALRDYDPQIGRFINSDPYDQFSSPYTGMGNDPTNSVDPSGGLNLGDVGQFTGSIFGDRLLAAGAGALVGFGVDKLTGGNGWTGAAIGAGAGFAATFIPASDVESLSELGKNVGSNVLANIAGENATRSITVQIERSTLQPSVYAPPLQNNPVNPGLPTQLPSTTPVDDVSPQGILFIKSWETLRTTAYDANPPHKDWTIGWGHKIQSGESFAETITRDEADRLFEIDLQRKAIDPILRNVRVPLSQQQFDALASYVFNTGSLRNTRLLTNINNHNFAAAAREMDIVTGNGVFLQGLSDRRIGERNIWNSGIYINHR